MPDDPIDLLFLGSGNAFGAEGRAFSSFLLNGRYLFDCGPTVLQQLRKAGVSANDIDAVFISHFHADHFFGLPFLLLEAKYGGRERDITIVGPPGIQERTDGLLRLGYPGLTSEAPSKFARNFIELKDRFEAKIAGLSIGAARVKHVDEFECFAFRAQVGGRALAYSGDSTLCDGLMRVVDGAEVIVLELSCTANEVHLSPDDVDLIAQRAPAGAKVIVTHLDGYNHPRDFHGLHVAADLERFTF